MASIKLLDQLIKHSLSIEKEILELQDKMRQDELLYEASLRDYMLDLLHGEPLDCDSPLTLIEQHQATIPSQQLLLDNLTEHTTMAYAPIMRDIHQLYYSVNSQQSYSTHPPPA
ncbi:hypothetical protein K501DRAFT_265205 [Backusella circina FSU 941]|nr:hypothetical protein K501DRAFT_265204 [Backusella circina FSU 941]KAI8891342.1 hypothetical protein K501DRAFT_265205 [Backusella circina FSU 941]